MANKKLLGAALLLILALATGVSFGQPIKEQIALQIISQRFGIPLSELTAIYQVALSEEDITRIKVLHIPRIRIYVVNLDDQNREISDAAMEQILAQRRGRGFVGKQEWALYEAARTGDPSEPIKVAAWLKQRPNPPRLDRDVPPSVNQVRLEALKRYHADLRRPMEELAAHNQGRVLYGSQLAPLVFIEVPKSFILGSAQTASLELHPGVEALYLSREYQPALNKSALAINADNLWNIGITGGNIKTAVVEYHSIVYSHPDLKDGMYCTPPSSPDDFDWHPTMVAGVIGSTHATFRGIAYGAPAILSGNSLSPYDSDLIRCTEWAITQGAKVINYSIVLDVWGNMIAFDHFVDYIVRYHFVTIVASAGNRGSDSYVSNPAIAFNVLAVGAFDDKDTATPSNPRWDDDEMWPSSCGKDPNSPHGDREKPELAAPGVVITSTDDRNGFRTESGTSFAAPHVVGAAALLMSRKSVLTSWPEEVRATLMASAIHNIEGTARLSEYDGAGGIDLASALTVLNNNWSDHGTFVRNDFPRSIHFVASGGQRVRFAIAWDSAPDQGPPWEPEKDLLKADFDLIIYAGGYPLTSSTSYDNSYEIVDFVAPFTGAYTAQITATRFQGNYEYLGWARFMSGQSSGTPALFRIERATGNAYTDGSWISGKADIAERIDVTEPVEPGDVVELNSDNPKGYRKTRTPYSPLLAGVISTAPGFILGNQSEQDSRPLLALIGRVPVKATAENGPISPGDLLTSSSKPGYAMRCEDVRRCEQALIGKALEPLTDGEGLILMLVMK